MRQEVTRLKTEKMFKALDFLQAKASILEHKNKGLENAIQFDKKTCTKKRKLNLQGGNAGEAQLWGMEEIEQAKAILRAKDEAEEQGKLDKAAKKAAAAALCI